MVSRCSTKASPQNLPHSLVSHKHPCLAPSAKLAAQSVYPAPPPRIPSNLRATPSPRLLAVIQCATKDPRFRRRPCLCRCRCPCFFGCHSAAKRRNLLLSLPLLVFAVAAACFCRCCCLFLPLPLPFPFRLSFRAQQGTASRSPTERHPPQNNLLKNAPKLACQPPISPQILQNPHPHCRFLSRQLGIVTPTHHLQLNQCLNPILPATKSPRPDIFRTWSQATAFLPKRERRTAISPPLTHRKRIL